MPITIKAQYLIGTKAYQFAVVMPIKSPYRVSLEYMPVKGHIIAHTLAGDSRDTIAPISSHHVIYSRMLDGKARSLSSSTTHCNVEYKIRCDAIPGASLKSKDAKQKSHVDRLVARRVSKEKGEGAAQGAGRDV